MAGAASQTLLSPGTRALPPVAGTATAWLLQIKAVFQ